MTIGIYGIFSATTKECLYIGQSKDIETRWNGHLKFLRLKKHVQKGFIEWFDNHGQNSESLLFEILEECENDDPIKNKLEIKWFNHQLPKFYGKFPSEKEKWTLTDETKMKIAESIRKANGNFSGVTKKKLLPICPECDRPTKCKFGTCTKCQAEIQFREIDTIWRDRIITWYVSEGLSCREIARRMNMEDKIRIPDYLRRYGIDVTPRTFNGQTFSDEHLHKLSKATTEKANETAIYIDCKNCNIKVRTRPSRLRKFCSRDCYKNYDRELQSSANV